MSRPTQPGDVQEVVSDPPGVVKCVVPGCTGSAVFPLREAPTVWERLTDRAQQKFCPKHQNWCIINIEPVTST